MGKEWHWAGKSSKRGEAGGGTEAEKQTQIQTETTPSGCMCAVFHFFDFHPFHFPTTINNQQQQTTFKSASCIPEDHTTVPKGAEAPRNSLESENGTISSLSKEYNFKIPKNIQIKTSGGNATSGGNLNDLSSEISNSPGTKTPTLVARLMGLDLLPGANSPSSSSSCISTPNPQGIIPNLHHFRPRQHIQTKPRNSTESEIAATRSLPETPRISSARRSDVEYHRLSLQINKENMGVGVDLDLPRFSFSKRKYDENNSRSPSHYARQIVKQVKESVSRKVGQDITNTLRSKEQAKEEFVGQFRIKKSPKSSVKALDESSPGKHSNHSSYSPRLRFMDTNNKHKPSITQSSPLIPKDQNTQPTVLQLPPPPVNTQPQLARVLTKPKPQQALPDQQELRKQKSVPKCKKESNEKFNSRLKRPPQTTDIIRKKQEESFIIRPTSPTRTIDIKTTKSKKTRPLSSNLLDNMNSVPNLLPVKTDPSPPATKIPQNQSQACDTQESKRISQLSSGSSQKYKQEGTSTLATRDIRNNEDKPNGASTIGAEQHTPEFQYITAILRRTTTITGVYKEAITTNTNTTITTVSFNQWFSQTLLLDPSIFHYLEEHHPTSTFYVSSPNKDKECNFDPKNQLGHSWNRRLLFDLVDEVLVEILRPKNSEKKLWFLHGCCYHGSVEGLVERVWKRIGKFPCAKCEVLEDIDGLIEAEDMEKVKVESEEGLEEEGEGLVAEIEGNIWDTLLHETVMVMEVR